MIRCAMDISIPENDKCDICCIHCSDKNCEYRCVGVDELKTEDKIEKYCINAYSMGVRENEQNEKNFKSQR